MPLQSDQLTCETEIDYSEITGERVLPFVIELDLTESVLDPGPGELQRFCYNVFGVGSDIPLDADLSHLVLGVCDQITEDQITNISVFIDGVEQPVDFGSGGNVELRPIGNPDPPTGCPGLKFNFGLDKVDGEMNLCFELTTPYPVGPNVVCLYGGGVTANQLSICGPVCPTEELCDVTGYQPFTVCVPVTVTPFANAGEPTTFCCGDPVVTANSAGCNGNPNGRCTFTVTQNICVTVPVEFGAVPSVGNVYVQCGSATPENICAGCGDSNDDDLRKI